MAELIHKLGLDWKLLLANSVTFLIVFWVLKRYAFGPIMRVLDERRAMAEKTVADNQAAAKARSLADEQHHEVVHEARRQAGEILVQARAEAEALRERELQLAQREAERLKSQAAANAVRDRNKLLAAARAELAGVVADAAGRLVEAESARQFDARAAEKILGEAKSA